MSIAIQNPHAVAAASSSSKIRRDVPVESHQTDDAAESLFSREELRQFSEDDTQAGRRIAKILAALFIYTLIAMGIATWWTFRTVGH